eukprot:gene12409-14184_t
MPTPHTPPAAVRRALRKLGADIHDARRRRKLPMAVVAERAFTSRSTLQKVEAGDTNVSIGIYAGVLQALGLLEALGQIADISNDSVGQALASADLPKHVHIDLHGRTRPIGLARSNRIRGAETILFEYDGAWLSDPDRFSLKPALALTRGAFAPPAGLATFGSI